MTINQLINLVNYNGGGEKITLPTPGFSSMGHMPFFPPPTIPKLLQFLVIYTILLFIWMNCCSVG